MKTNEQQQLLLMKVNLINVILMANYYMEYRRGELDIK